MIENYSRRSGKTRSNVWRPQVYQLFEILDKIFKNMFENIQIFLIRSKIEN